MNDAHKKRQLLKEKLEREAIRSGNEEFLDMWQCMVCGETFPGDQDDVTPGADSYEFVCEVCEAEDTNA